MGNKLPCLYYGSNNDMLEIGPRVFIKKFRHGVSGVVHLFPDNVWLFFRRFLEFGHEAFNRGNLSSVGNLNSCNGMS